MFCLKFVYLKKKSCALLLRKVFAFKTFSPIFSKFPSISLRVCLKLTKGPHWQNLRGRRLSCPGNGWYWKFEEEDVPNRWMCMIRTFVTMTLLYVYLWDAQQTLSQFFQLFFIKFFFETWKIERLHAACDCNPLNDILKIQQTK